MSYVIAVLNQKGGSGKTTISTQIARQLQILGNDVVLVDSDPQGSARDWAAVDENNKLSVIGIDRPTLVKDIKSLNKDFIVIDGAPQAADLAASAIKAANMVIIPVQPSPLDMWASNDLIDLVKQRIEITEGYLKAALVVSRLITGTKIGRDVLEALKGFELPIFKTSIKQRVIYPVAASNGQAVIDFEPQSDAAFEVRELTKEIIEFMQS